MASPVAAAAAGGPAGGDVDQDAFSRQLLSLGLRAQQRIQAATFLVINCRGAGIEAAKNLVLMGAGCVLLCDNTAATWGDLSANFFLTPDDVGKPRADCVVGKVAQLSQRCTVRVWNGDVTAERLTADKIHAVIATDCLEEDAVRMDAACRSAGSAFVAGESRGAFGRVFVDAGDKHTVVEVGDSPAKVLAVTGVSAAEKAVVTVANTFHGLEDGTLVQLTGLEGPDAANDAPALPITVTAPNAFELPIDTRSMPAYVRGGYAKEVKRPVDVSHKPLSAALREPEILTQWTDFTPIHRAFAALHAVMAEAGGDAPAPGDEAAVEAVAAALAAPQEGDAGVARQLARCASGQLGPLGAVVGAFAAQEALKIVSAQWVPIQQWLYVDCAPALPAADSAWHPTTAELQPAGDRYDGIAAVFGRRMVRHLRGMSGFLVGSGAIGCEMLKNWALLGLGDVTVTDMDDIERSNLSRQFLFRSSDIGKPKSVAAAAAAAAMNPDMKVRAMTVRVAPDTESTFNTAFWQGLDIVCTALDNLQARKYVDGRCVQFHKPMLESGTQGARGNTQVVVPRLTVPYSDGTNEPAPEQFAVCTVKMYPYRIEHTLQYAREWLEGALAVAPADANRFAADRDGLLGSFAANPGSELEVLLRVKRELVEERPLLVEDCLRWARLKFQELFHDNIVQLLHVSPADRRLDTGELFWSGLKRLPKPLLFDGTDPLHLAFVRSLTQLRASVFGLNAPTGPDADAWYAEKASDIQVPAFVPDGDAKAPADDEEHKKMEEEAAAQVDALSLREEVQQLLESLPPPGALAGLRLSPVVFEKDDPLHIAFVAACSNLRARNYGIGEVSELQSKGIVGNIIPAIATTTTIVAGLVSLELFKVVQGLPLEAYRSIFLSLAVPTISRVEPSPCTTTAVTLPAGAKYVPTGVEPATVDTDAERTWNWSCWDEFKVRGPLTLQQLCDWTQDQLGQELDCLTFGNAMLYASFAPPPPGADPLAMGIAQLATEVTNEPLPQGEATIALELGLEDDEVELPTLFYVMSPEEAQRFATGGPSAAAADA